MTVDEGASVKADVSFSTQETNLLGTYLMTEKYIGSLKDGEATGHGTVINIASQLAFEELPGMSAYSISKMVVVKLAQFIDAGESDSQLYQQISNIGCSTR